MRQPLKKIKSTQQKVLNFIHTLQSGLHYISAENLTDNYIEHWPTNTQITPKKTAERKMKLTLKYTIIILFHCVMWQRKVWGKLHFRHLTSNLHILCLGSFKKLRGHMTFLTILEIKPCGLGSRSPDMEAESHNWSHFLVNLL